MTPNNSDPKHEAPKTQTYDSAAVEAALRNFEARQNELKNRTRVHGGYDPKTGMPLQADAPQKPQQNAPQQKTPQQPTRTNPAQGGNAPAGGNKPASAPGAPQAKAQPKPAPSKVPTTPKDSQADTPTREQKAIENWLKTTTFKKKLLGGVDEADVWKKIGELNSLYEAALAAERARCDAMIEHYKQAATSASARRERTGE